MAQDLDPPEPPIVVILRPDGSSIEIDAHGNAKHRTKEPPQFPPFKELHRAKYNQVCLDLDDDKYVVRLYPSADLLPIAAGVMQCSRGHVVEARWNREAGAVELILQRGMRTSRKPPPPAPFLG